MTRQFTVLQYTMISFYIGFLVFFLSTSALAAMAPSTIRIRHRRTVNHYPPCARHAIRVQLSGTSLPSDDEDGTCSPPAHLVFPGGGIFFYWQAGAVTYLREQGYDLSKTTLVGASAGALTATLTATEVDFYRATKLALQLAEDAGVWERAGGLQGVWGPMIATWLEELLPQDSIHMVEGRLSLLLTTVPTFSKRRVSDFGNKHDLVQCNMSSVHLPWFLDGKIISTFRNEAYIDGSFLAGDVDYSPRDNRQPLIRFDWTEDPAMQGKSLDFVKAGSKDWIWSILEQGKSFAKVMEKRGDFVSLRRTNEASISVKR